MSRSIWVGSFEELGPIVIPIREQVFVVEQGVPPEIERDDRDAVSQHVVVVEDGLFVGTGRIDLEHDGKIGRLAVLERSRNRNFGTLIMRALEEIAMREDLVSVWLHSQIAVVPFYQHLGYAEDGDEFTEAGISHIPMRKKL